MEIWIKQGSKKLRLPINPASYSIESQQENTSVTVHAVGEFTLKGKRKLRGISFSSIFPNQGYSFCTYSRFPNPAACCSLIEKMKRAGTVKLIMTGIISATCTIESFTYSENDATHDRNFDISFKEYKPASLKAASTKITVNRQSRIINLPSTKRVIKEVEPVINYYWNKQKDSITQVSQKLTGSSANYAAILLQNGYTNQMQIADGAKLVIKFGSLA